MITEFSIRIEKVEETWYVLVKKTPQKSPVVFIDKDLVEVIKNAVDYAFEKV